MNKIISFFALMVLAVFITGCEGTTRTSSDAFVGGTEAVKLSFMPGSPPETIVDGGQSSFTIAVKIENVGEHDIKQSDKGYVKVKGLEPGSYGNTKNFLTDITDIDGARKNFDGSVRNGLMSTVDFGTLSYKNTIVGDLQQQIYAEACYNYKTKMATQICVKQDAQQSLNDERICEVEGEKNPQNSGAPVHITSVKESFAGNGKIGLILTISHVGTGDGPFKDTLSVCNDVETNNDKNKIYVSFSPVRINNKDIYPVCSGLQDKKSDHQGYVKLYTDNSNKATTTLYCTLDVGTTFEGVFEVPLEAELSYKYLQHINTNLKIRHVAK